MTGIVILPAGRDDAFEDYKQFIRDGHPIADIEIMSHISLTRTSNYIARLLKQPFHNPCRDERGGVDMNTPSSK